MEPITIHLEESTLSFDVLNVIDEILEPKGDRTPITELLTESNDEKSSKISVDDLGR